MLIPEGSSNLAKNSVPEEAFSRNTLRHLAQRHFGSFVSQAWRTQNVLFWKTWICEARRRKLFLQAFAKSSPRQHVYQKLRFVPPRVTVTEFVWEIYHWYNGVYPYFLTLCTITQSAVFQSRAIAARTVKSLYLSSTILGIDD